MALVIKQVPRFNKMTTLLTRIQSASVEPILHRWGSIGVDRLRIATPVDTGLTANSWTYSVSKTSEGYLVSWSNDNLSVGGVPVVVLLEYGHGTLNGGFVPGLRFVNDVLTKLKTEMMADLRKEVLDG